MTVLFPQALLTRPTLHRTKTDMTRERFSFSELGSTLLELWRLMTSGLKLSSENLQKYIYSMFSTSVIISYLRLDATCAVWYQFGLLLLTTLHTCTLCRICRNFQLGLLIFIASGLVSSANSCLYYPFNYQHQI